MNDGHRIVCGGDEWRETVRDHIIPWVLDGIELGDDAVELGPGYGATTDVLQFQVAKLTAVEIDPKLAAMLIERFSGTNVRVIEGDATALEFDDGRFSAAMSFSMLHHVPSPELQDRVFAEARRVVRAGGVFAATDGLDNDDVRAFHDDDTYVPIDPATLPDRLRAAGFDEITVDQNEYAWKATAR
jgi:SAM-dependent methyltransferase